MSGDDGRGGPAGTVRAVVFDAGMTLIHPNHHVIVRHLSPAFHDGEVPTREAILAALSLSAEVHHFGSGAEVDRRERALDALCLLLELDRSCRELVRAALADPNLYSAVDPQAACVMRGLRSRGVAVGVVSNSDGTLIEDLAQAGLLELVDSAVDSSVVGYAKPDTRIFREGCDQLDVSPEQAIYVGDDLGNDVLGARSAGYRDAWLFDPYDVYHVPGVRRIQQLNTILDILDHAEP